MPAIVAASIIGGVAGLGAAKVQSNAASKAQKAQQDATDKALAVQQQTSKPYTDLGAAAAGRLGQQAANFQPYTQQFRPGQPNNGFQAPPGMGQPSGPPPTLGGIGMQQPQGPPGGQMATVQAPTGQMARIPVGPDLDKALAAGAKRLM